MSLYSRSTGEASRHDEAGMIERIEQLSKERDTLRILVRDGLGLLGKCKPRLIKVPILTAEIEAWQEHAQDVLGRSEL